MSEPSDRKVDAAAADDLAEFTVTAFGRRRVGGAPWSARRLGWLALWPFTFFARRKAARDRFPRSQR
jgi:hypothetical protein